jgi:hypothetical protein
MAFLYDSLQKQKDALKRQKYDAHQSLMKQQERTAKSKASGRKKVENKKWMKSVGDLKCMNAEVAQGKQLHTIDKKKQEILEQMQQLNLPEIIVPKFYFNWAGYKPSPLGGTTSTTA